MTNRLEDYDFLTEMQENTLRKAALNNLSSYNQVYDVLAESLQNAVDAIEDRYLQDSTTAETKIEIIFDVSQRSISVSDTGTGMSWENMRNAPALNVTKKQEGGIRTNSSKRTRGEKGVGLSFLTFTCNELRIKSCDGLETISAKITGSNDWMHERSSNKPIVRPINHEPEDVTEHLGSNTYTIMEMKDIRTQDYCDIDIFELHLQQLIYMIRTNTAIGNTEKITLGRTPEPHIDVTLKYIDAAGDEKIISIPYLYLSPSEYFSDASILTFDRFQELQKKDKLNLAQGKALVYMSTKQTPSGRNVHCYAFSVPAKTFQELSKDRMLEDGWAPEEWVGIYVATRGMPTGIKIDPPVTYSAGYWRRVLLLLQDDQMNFDIGRKTLRGMAKPMMQNIAREVWNDILPYLQALTPSDSESVKRDKQGKITQLFQEALKWPDLDYSSVQYLKEPQREQMVVALFYELVGSGILTGYRTLRNNTVDQYDAFVQYVIDKNRIGRMEAAQIKGSEINDFIIVEFKYDAESILFDFLENAKRYQDINLLVCWELDEKKFADKSIDVDPIPPEAVYYFGSTHNLYFPGIYQAGDRLAVIELKTFLEKAKKLT